MKEKNRFKELTNKKYELFTLLKGELRELPLCGALSQKVPYKKFFSYSLSKKHQTEVYNLSSFYKPICKH